MHLKEGKRLFLDKEAMPLCAKNEFYQYVK